MSDPKIIFGDEPTGALNSKAAQEIMEILAEVNRAGTAILLVTHDAKVAAQARRVLFMRDGAIVSELDYSGFDSGSLEARMEYISEKMRDIEI